MTKSSAIHILGLKPDFSEDELKVCYRKMARKYHPDINKSADAGNMFMLVKEAYDYLLKNGGVGRLSLVTHKSIFSIIKKS